MAGAAASGGTSHLQGTVLHHTSLLPTTVHCNPSYDMVCRRALCASTLTVPQPLTSPVPPMFSFPFLSSEQHVGTYKRTSCIAGAATSCALRPTTAAPGRAETSRRTSTTADVVSTNARGAASVWRASASSTVLRGNDDRHRITLLYGTLSLSLHCATVTVLLALLSL